MTRPDQQPRLVDAGALAQRRARARLDRAGFLHDEAMVEIEERLIDVNRRFTSPAIVTPFAAKWTGFLPKARLVADDELLDLQPGAHDLVIHAMGLHWANDPVGQIVQCRRALKPDGLFLAVCFGGETLIELRQTLAEAEIATLGGLSPRVAPMAEIRDMGSLLQRAGLALPVADRVKRTVHYSDAFALMRDLRDMGEGNALSDRHRSPVPRTVFAQMAALYADRFGTPDGRVAATFDLAFLTGWAPHDSQQKPLRPGAARHRLADALNTTEFDETAIPALHGPDE
ncbi:SAM-dependent methyltransferase, BioC-like protein [Roseibacterium elongatum DSM 19469]|uniref:SAM-dependent methyltransferase, BioC-like protein n=1 Tax=Roseicyclus elongatus DSM 19469 TaxID=1294273 RepID=W8RQC3_9RHOB|nr:methyltransferase domain-containing protein [Roseibacterium elongatum]AHM03364.1 SAM-dependent methyltransferase, BioC-like protein [Roseibacterium elongatum DSM 19469]